MFHNIISVKMSISRLIRRYHLWTVLPFVSLLSLCCMYVYLRPAKLGGNVEINLFSDEVFVREATTIKPKSKDVQEVAVALSDGVGNLGKDGRDFESVSKLDQMDPELIKYIRKFHLTPPSDKPYALSDANKYHANGYSSYAFNAFSKKTVGVFVEAGAYDGEAASNSLYFEENGWEGLLVECNPLMLPKLRAKNRKAWIADVCLSLSNTPQLLNFSTPIDWPASAKLGRPLNNEEMKKEGIDWMKNKTWLNYPLPCFPLYSLLKATGLPVVDFFSLDVQGAEWDILRHFPFDDFQIKMLMLEVTSFSPSGKTELINFMKSKGYKLTRDFESDLIFTLESEGFL